MSAFTETQLPKRVFYSCCWDPHDASGWSMIASGLWWLKSPPSCMHAAHRLDRPPDRATKRQLCKNNDASTVRRTAAGVLVRSLRAAAPSQFNAFNFRKYLQFFAPMESLAHTRPLGTIQTVTRTSTPQNAHHPRRFPALPTSTFAARLLHRLPHNLLRAARCASRRRRMAARHRTRKTPIKPFR